MLQNELYEFGDFRLHVQERLLSREGSAVHLPPKTFDVLVALVRRRGRLISKRELLAMIWPDAFVEMGIVTVHMSSLRKALGDVGRPARFIETVSRSGYRFKAPVRTVDTEPDDTRTGTIRLAVLPFKPLVEDLRDFAFEMGLTELVISALGRERGFVVPPLGVVRKYAELDQDPLAAGRALDVTFVLDGTIRHQSGEMVVAARLLNVSDGTSAWSSTIARRSLDTFDVEDTIAQQVSAALALHPGSPAPARSLTRYTKNAEAYLLYLKGRYLWERRTDESQLQAIEHFEAAVEKDPSYALAYSGLGACYGTLPFTNGFPPRDAFYKSRLALLRALELDESLSEAHESLGGYKFWHEWNWTGAEAEFRRAIGLAPDQSAPHRFFGYFLSTMGRHEEALQEVSIALQLEPTSVITLARLGQVLYQAGDLDGARQRLEEARKHNPDFWLTRLNLGRVYERQGNYDSALGELNAAVDRARGSGEVKGVLGYTLAACGQSAAARHVAEDLESAEARGLVYGYQLALIAAGSRDRDRMYTHLHAALNDRDVGLTFLLAEPRWKPHLHEPAFRDILERVGLGKMRSESDRRLKPSATEWRSRSSPRW